MARRRSTAFPGAAMLKAMVPKPPRRRRRRRATPKAPKITPVLIPVPKQPPIPGRGRWLTYRHAGPAGSRAYFVYVPHGLRRTSRVPMLVALHGCGQTAADFAAATRFNELADRQRLIVVYPQQSITRNAQLCWNWFESGHQFRGGGEPAIIAGIVREVRNRTLLWNIDPARVYAAGLSAGGTMAVTLGACYPELFAAVAIHSGPPYGSASSSRTAMASMMGARFRPPPPHGPVVALPPMIVFQGTSDPTVSSVNAKRLTEQWISFYESGVGGRTVDEPLRRRDIEKPKAQPVTDRSRRGYRVSRWYAAGRKVLELWTIDGLGHAWSGGSPSGSYADRRGPRATTEIWKFFSQHPAVTVTRQAAG